MICNIHVLSDLGSPLPDYLLIKPISFKNPHAYIINYQVYGFRYFIKTKITL